MYNYLLEVNVVHISCTLFENGENESPTEQTTEHPENPTAQSEDSTRTAALSIGIICVIFLIAIVAAFFLYVFFQRRTAKSERYVHPQLINHLFLCSFPNSSIVVVGDNVSYIIPASARIKSTTEAPYFSSVINLPQGNLVLSTEQPLPKTPLCSGEVQNKVTHEHVYDTLGEFQMDSNDEKQGDEMEEANGQN